ncbi:MAG: hypothetical protein E6R03_12705 [Hyphomicrobiaceae bacterium]|nr:MAG: hypothetical protein E6R03_12705 [Hyphomicrobiaceae bacterium]
MTMHRIPEGRTTYLSRERLMEVDHRVGRAKQKHKATPMRPKHRATNISTGSNFKRPDRIAG